MAIEEWSLEEQGLTEALNIEGGGIALKVDSHLATDSLFENPSRTNCVCHI